MHITYGRYKINTLAKVVFNQTSKIANRITCTIVPAKHFHNNVILHYDSLSWSWLMKKMMTKISLKIHYKHLRSNLILSIKLLPKWPIPLPPVTPYFCKKLFFSFLFKSKLVNVLNLSIFFSDLVNVSSKIC